MAEGFAPWCCPLCGAPLAGDNALKCPSGHSFDRAKEGYWHLLPVQNTRTKAPGDSREMVAARRAFLSAGYYGIFGQALGELCLEYGQPKAGKPLRLLDAGCGEGWYDRCIAKQFEEAGRPLELAGFDIAKPAAPSTPTTWSLWSGCAAQTAPYRQRTKQQNNGNLADRLNFDQSFYGNCRLSTICNYAILSK